jgi:hypothetical protein
VQALPSLHDVPSGFEGYTHWPVALSQLGASWHCPGGASHDTRPAPEHAPASQRSPVVHASPSLHGVPSGFGTFGHDPVEGSHVPAS